MSRTTNIKNHLIKHKSISVGEAWNEYGINYTGLNYVIHYLRNHHKMKIGLSNESKRVGIYSDFILVQ